LKVLVLGADGMLGHKICQVLEHHFETIGTVRAGNDTLANTGIFKKAEIIPYVDVKHIGLFEEVLKRSSPNAVINCTGIIKQAKHTANRLNNIWVNSLFPHQLNRICQDNGIKLIHISTDCVFSGKKGNYTENDLGDAEDDYGKSKYLGEVTDSPALTIRTSLIGRELATSYSLVEWFLSNQGSAVNGFTNAIFTGLPTLHFAQIIADIITNHKTLSGLYHVSSEPISKYKLLELIKQKMKLDIEVNSFPGYYCDRSLNSELFRKETGFSSLPWETMIEEFAQDARQYSKWRT